ncbi:MAG: hypothetical protein AB7Q81_22570 [Gammaproteobacteria bacterium]
MAGGRERPDSILLTPRKTRGFLNEMPVELAVLDRDAVYAMQIPAAPDYLFDFGADEVWSLRTALANGEQAYLQGSAVVPSPPPVALLPRRSRRRAVRPAAR